MEKRLAAALALERPTERKLAVVALIDELVQRIGFSRDRDRLAVEFWTHGAYATSDIDLYLPHGPAVDDLLGDLGFQTRSDELDRARLARRVAAEGLGGALRGDRGGQREDRGRRDHRKLGAPRAGRSAPPPTLSV